jgi:hypothetical protein
VEGSLKASLLKLKSDLHFTRQICEHSNNKNVCCFLYCYKLHYIRKDGRKIFENDSLTTDYKFYFLEPLKNAKRYCFSDCKMSRYYFRIAEKYVNNLIKLLR